MRLHVRAHFWCHSQRMSVGSVLWFTMWHVTASSLERTYSQRYRTVIEKESHVSERNIEKLNAC